MSQIPFFFSPPNHNGHKHESNYGAQCWLYYINSNSAIQSSITTAHSTYWQLQFHIWKAQLTMLLEGHDLYGHLDGTKPTPTTTITRNNWEEVNLAYRLWVHQDRLIQQAMMASVNITVASTVTGASNTQKAWTLLHMSYANKSYTRIYNLRDQLNRVTKDDKTVAKYLQTISSWNYLRMLFSSKFEGKNILDIWN